MPFCCMRGLENAIFYRGLENVILLCRGLGNANFMYRGLEKAIVLYRGSGKCIFCIGGLENVILLYRRGSQDAILLYRGSRKCHFCIGVSEMPFCCIGGSGKFHFLYGAFIKLSIVKMSSLSPFLNGIAL